MSTTELMQVQEFSQAAEAAHHEPAGSLEVEQSGTGALETATAVTDEAVSVSVDQVPTPEEHVETVNDTPLPDLPPSPSPSPSTMPPTLVSTPSQSQVEALKLRPSPKEVISGIAPHVFDERKRRPQRVRRTSTSSSRRGYGGGQGRPPRPRAAPSPSSSQPNLRQSNSNSASMRRYGGSPLRFSASFTFEDLPHLQVEVQAKVDFVQVGPRQQSSNNTNEIETLETPKTAHPTPTSDTSSYSSPFTGPDSIVNRGSEVVNTDEMENARHSDRRAIVQNDRDETQTQDIDQFISNRPPLP
ncbi:hypothetical protein AAF712_009281 [Marasmius tenuissimus]|uniref:Uncharacterized protein n=1 Tax=Marasmius tenuissimus TaxID=585030 RepID=A0ABR2ZQI0_9AGAR